MSLDPKQKGKWEVPFSIENVACHATLLPNGKILCWSRRSNPMSPIADMNEQRTNAFLIDLQAVGGPRCSYTGNQPQSFAFSGPTVSKDSNISLFCSGHCLMADGNVFVIGGHLRDSHGQNQACIYDYTKDHWSALPPPGIGRWYPSAVSLPDSSVLVMSGSDEQSILVQHPQIWRKDRWDQTWDGNSNKWDPKPVQTTLMAGIGGSMLALYPRLHLDPFGQVFMAGPTSRSLSFDINAVSSTATGQWGDIGDKQDHKAVSRENGAAVTYDVGKVLWTGGGNDGMVKVDGFEKNISGPPTDRTVIINLNDDDSKRKWKETPDLNTRRRQHNLTTLPDGTVLATGGTSGLGFNDLRTGMPVHTPELWNPTESEWTEMAEESTDRCYHGVALLLPDGSVFSAGGGEGGEFDAPPNPRIPNPARDNHTNAQIYKPPYFFLDAEVPMVTSVPVEAKYGQPFDVVLESKDPIEKISWIRLPSVTHGLNSSQSVYFVKAKVPNNGKLTVTPPNNRNIATPGFYMLFFVSEKGRPSVAEIIRILPDRTDEEVIPIPTQKRDTKGATNSNKIKSRTAAQTAGNLRELDQKVVADLDGPAIKVGLTPVCPYGLGACWAGAFEGLHRIDDIDIVRPLPDSANSVAYVYLKKDRLPDIDVWRKEIAQTAGGTYDLRGIELQLTGQVKKQQVSDGDGLILSGSSTRPEVIIAPFKAISKLERDHKAQTLIPVSDDELNAYTSLVELVAGSADGVAVEVTGRLHKHAENKFSLDVRSFAVKDDAGDV